MGGLDHERVYGLHVGDEREALLLTADLEALTAAAPGGAEPATDPEIEQLRREVAVLRYNHADGCSQAMCQAQDDAAELAELRAAVERVVARMGSRKVDHRHEDETGHWGVKGRAYFYAGDVYDDWRDLSDALRAALVEDPPAPEPERPLRDVPTSLLAAEIRRRNEESMRPTPHIASGAPEPERAEPCETCGEPVGLSDEAVAAHLRDVDLRAAAGGADTPGADRG